MDGFEDKYVIMHPRGKLLSDKTKSGLTSKFHEAKVVTYDHAIGFCRETYEDRGEMYSPHHIDIFKNNNSYGLRVPFGVNKNNLKRLFKSIDENHYILSSIEEMYNFK